MFICRLSNLEELVINHNELEVRQAVLLGIITTQNMSYSINLYFIQEFQELLSTMFMLQSLPGAIGLLRKLRILYADENFLEAIPLEVYIYFYLGLRKVSIQHSNNKFFHS